MTPEKLQNWLLTDGIHVDLKRVAQLTATTEIDNLEPSVDTDSLTKEIEWNRLLLAGSILARSEQRKHQEAALRIATGALILKGHPTICK